MQHRSAVFELLRRFLEQWLRGDNVVSDGNMAESSAIYS